MTRFWPPSCKESGATKKVYGTFASMCNELKRRQAKHQCRPELLTYDIETGE